MFHLTCDSIKMKYNYFILISSILSLFLFSSCIEEFNDEIPQEQSNLLVVQGQVVSQGYTYLELSRSLPLEPDSETFKRTEGDLTIPVKYAKVSLRGTDGSETPFNSIYSYYYLQETPQLKPDVAYYVRIETNGDIFESIPEKPVESADIDSVEYYQPTKESNVDILITTAPKKNSDKPIYFEWGFFETWEVRPMYFSVFAYDIENRKIINRFDLYPARGWGSATRKRKVESTVQYSNQQLKKYKLFDIARTDERLFYNYYVNISQRAISKGEYEYLLACQKANSQMGGLFSPQASTLPTNIRCTNGSKLAIGYIGISNQVIYKEFYIKGDSVSTKKPKAPYINITSNPSANLCETLWSEHNRIIRLNPDPYNPDWCQSLWWVPEEYVDLRIRDDLLFEKPGYMP